MHCASNRCWAIASVIAILCTMVQVVACASGGNQPDNGTVVPQQLDIRGFSYLPPSPIHVGDLVRFTAAIFQPDLVSAEVFATGEGNGDLRLALRDDGVTPDVVAGDHIWTAAVQWPAEIGVGIMAVSLEVKATVAGVLVTDKRLVPWLYVDP